MYPVYNKFYYKPLPDCIEVKKSPIEGFGLFAVDDINEETILKEECYLFDFAPNRALKLVTD